MDVTYRKERISGILEFLFWGYLMYSMISDPLGLSFPLIPGAWLSLLALASIFNVNWKLSARIPMLFILAISGMLVAVQCFVHQMPITTNYIWSFVMWIPLAMVIFLLSGRPGFIKRLAVVMFLIGLVFRFWVATKMDIIARQELSAGTIANANDYAACIGFLAVELEIKTWIFPPSITGRFCGINLFFAGHSQPGRSAFSGGWYPDWFAWLFQETGLVECTGLAGLGGYHPSDYFSRFDY